MTLGPPQALELLEREPELDALAAAVASAGDGSGVLVVVEGEAGVGKTELLAAGARRAAEAGLETLHARGGELERGLTFGVARQLLETRLARAPEPVQQEMFSGAARVTRGLLGLDPSVAGALDEPSLIHGLYWLCANLAERRPLCLVIDDVQWSDGASLRFLTYLGRRLHELPVVVLVGLRSGEPDGPDDLLESLVTQPDVRRLRPTPLTAVAMATLVAAAYQRSVDTAFATAVFEATGGNPFLARELLAGLVEDGVDPVASDVVKVSELHPEGVARAILLRLSRLPAEATSLARAIAVLGTEASLGQAAALSELDPDSAARAADALVSAQLLKPSRPLEFIHPVVRSVLYGDIPTGERSRSHARAARVLEDEGRASADVAAHLLMTEPAGDHGVVEAIRKAVAQETDPTRATVLLERALSEPPATGDRASLLLELGEAEARAYRPQAIEHLREARELTSDPKQEVRAARALARAWTLHAEPSAAVDWARAERAALGDATDHDKRDLRLALLALEVIRGPVDAELAAELRVEAAAASTVAERYLLAALAYKTISWGTAEDSLVLGEAAMRGGLLDEGVRGTGFILAISAIQQAGAHARVREIARRAVSDARARGDLSGYALAIGLQADAAKHNGLLNEARDDATEGLMLAREHDVDWGEPVFIEMLLDICAEQGRLADGEALIAAREPDSWLSGSSRAAQYLHGRGLFRLAQGDAVAALADLQAAGTEAERYEAGHPVFIPWRSSTARALLALGRAEEAEQLVLAELELARAFGAAHAIGPPLRMLGLIRGGEDGLELLDESVDVLSDSQALLDRARSLVEFGAALRRANQRAAARDPLRRGLDLAQQCGATVLAERAEHELEATGARPRRRELSGIDALTPSERRVAEMAARGMSNRDIAQELFVSIRTIENQLRHVYAKLDIAGRKELPGVFDG